MADRTDERGPFGRPGRARRSVGATLGPHRRRSRLHQDANALNAATHRVRLLQALEGKGATIEEDYR